MRTAWVWVVCAGCSPTRAPLVPLAESGPPAGATGSAASAPIVASPPGEDEPAERDEALLAQLAQEKLVGFAVADPLALYFPTESAARAAPLGFRPGQPDGVGDGLRVREDLGAVVRVSTQGGEDFGGVDGRFALEVFVQRSALLPVLRAPRKESFPDGTAVLLREGLVLEPLRGGSRPAHPLLAGVLTAPIDAADVGLSFVSPKERPLLDPLDTSLVEPVLGCERENAADFKLSVRVDDRAAMIQEEGEARNGGDRVYDLIGMPFANEHAFRCTFTDGSSLYVGVEDAMLRIDGRELGRATEVPLEPCGGRVEARRVPTDVDSAFVTVTLPRAELRVRAPLTSLVEAGGCGAASLGGPRPKVKALRHEATAYFPDGSQAGVHLGHATKLRNVGAVTESGGRTCVHPTYLTTPLCFDPADLLDVDD